MTRVWALSEVSDPFSNFISYTYTNDSNNGSFYPNEISYGGNRSLSISHVRKVAFTYATRPDTRTEYIGGYKVHIDRCLSTIVASVDEELIHTHSFDYVLAPLTLESQLSVITLSDASSAPVSPLRFDWSSGQPSVFESVKTVATLNNGVSDFQVLGMDVTASGRTDMVVTSAQIDESYGDERLYLNVHLADGQGGVSASPSFSTATGLYPPDQLLPVDINGDGQMDLVGIFLPHFCPFTDISMSILSFISSQLVETGRSTS